MSPTLLREKREYRSSHFRSRSTEDLISGHKAVRPSFLSRSFGESFTSEVPVFEGQVSVQWTKTRQSILRGDRSPLGNHQLELPRRRRQKRTKATETHPNMSENGEMPEPTPQWDLFVTIAEHFSRNLPTELTKMAAALQEEYTDQDEFEDMLTDIADMEQELQSHETSWKSLMAMENIAPEEWSGVGDKIRTNRKSIAKMKRKIQKRSGQDTQQNASAGVSSQNNDLVAALRSVTQAPVVRLPTFDGKIAEFAGFKKKF